MRLSRRIGLALVSLACAIAAANWAVGRWFPIPVHMYRTDPQLIYLPIPGARSVKSVQSDGASRWVRTEIDAQGYRGRDLAVPKRGPRIAVYGDSFAFAEDVPLEQTFVEELGRALAPSDPPEMVNAGVVGYGPDQACLRMEQEFDTLQPDLVVLVLCSANDFGDLVRDKLFGFDAAGNLTQNQVSFAPQLLSEFESKSRAAEAPALVRAWRSWRSEREERARIAAAGGRKPPWIDWYLTQGHDEYSEYVLEHQLAVRQVWQDYYDADIAIHPERDSSIYKRKLMRVVLERMRDQCARRAIPFAALIVPCAVDLGSDNEIRVDPAKYPSWSPTRLTGALAEILDGLGVPYVNLYAPFQEGGPEHFFIGDGNMHWNEVGQQLAARLTAELLRGRALWPPARR